MTQRILIVEDDPDIGALLRLHAAEGGNEVRLVAHGTQGLMVAQASGWDLVIVDWLLPGTDGVTICQRLRLQGRLLPILFLTARASEHDRVHGLDAGADDYVAKPFSVLEFKARVRAQLRRAAAIRGEKSGAATATTLELGALYIDPAARIVKFRSRQVPLTGREFDLLWHFATHPNRVFTRQQLLAAVWGSGFEGYEHTVNSHINRLRAKFALDAPSDSIVSTVWGTGYRFDASRLS